jgi:hypothetical protein
MRSLPGRTANHPRGITTSGSTGISAPTLDLPGKQLASVITAGKLATLIGAEDAGNVICQCDSQGIQALARNADPGCHFRHRLTPISCLANRLSPEFFAISLPTHTRLRYSYIVTLESTCESQGASKRYRHYPAN